MSSDLLLSAAPTVRAAMGIRRPAAEVFDAFIDPETITRFWIFGSTGPLVAGDTVAWTMNDAGAQATVVVREVDPTSRLVFDWGDDEAMSQVEFQFSATEDGFCSVEVTETGLTGTGDELAARASDSTGGFTMVLCSLKALLEHGIELGAVSDRFLE
ncbi:SRPBCC domain-containing protein [Dietzia alimentaria]|uniref:SRPBCC domain-containing protein n=1 Tax=Dietzia alimentaria TaxID=665550 RepID=UPI00029AF452|nr:SRPBCC domain-containing protein [Dietzia alimentaria]